MTPITSVSQCNGCPRVDLHVLMCSWCHCVCCVPLHLGMLSYVGIIDIGLWFLRAVIIVVDP